MFEYWVNVVYNYERNICQIKINIQFLSIVFTKFLFTFNSMLTDEDFYHLLNSFVNSQDIGPTSGLEVITLFSCLTHLSMKLILLINVKMPTIVGILTFMSRINTTS